MSHRFPSMAVGTSCFVALDSVTSTFVRFPSSFVYSIQATIMTIADMAVGHFFRRHNNFGPGIGVSNSMRVLFYSRKFLIIFT